MNSTQQSKVLAEHFNQLRIVIFSPVNGNIHVKAEAATMYNDPFLLLPVSALDAEALAKVSQFCTQYDGVLSLDYTKQQRLVLRFSSYILAHKL